VNYTPFVYSQPRSIVNVIPFYHFNPILSLHQSGA